MKTLPIAIPVDTLAEFCRRNRVRRLALFGSVLRDDFTPRSDVDMLLEFEPGHGVGLIRFAGMENALSRMLNCKVDLRTAEDLSPYFVDEVLKEAVPIYVAS